MPVAELHEIARPHAADLAFDQLASAILRGDLAPGSALPPERVLSERFGVSRVIARQAIHRLADMALVRVKQGGGTVVLDPAAATDLRVLALFYRFAHGGARSERDTADMIEKQYLQGMSILDVAARRASRKDLERLARSIDEEPPSDVSAFPAFEERFWRALSVAGKNRIFVMEVGWWYETLTDRPVPARVASTALSLRVAFCRELVRRLLEDDEPVEFYIKSVRPMLDELFSSKKKMKIKHRRAEHRIVSS
jgi:DNA-binding FadR family transcriptional regulator